MSKSDHVKWLWGLASGAVLACTAPAPKGPEASTDGHLAVAATEHIRLVGFNDFHGNLSATRTVEGRPVGGAAVLAAYIHRAVEEVEGRALVIHAGDQVGASPPVSALLQDEPSIMFMNLLGNTSCSAERRDDSRCNLVGALGNHEFDEGRGELMRLIDGGDSSLGPFLESPYRGAAFAHVCANVIDAQTGAPLVRPYVIRKVGNVSVGVVGAVVRETPTIVTPSGVASLSFLDEAEAINGAVDALVRMGIRTIVVTIHQGGSQNAYEGPTRDGALLTGDIMPIVDRLNDEVDVVISGHAHQFSNALVSTRTQKPVLVTQAWSAGTALAEIDLTVDLATGDVVHKTARVVTTFADVPPGNKPDPRVRSLVERAESLVGPRVNRVVGRVVSPIARAPNESGESALGNLIADAQRESAGTDVALTNLGGLRADLDAGEVTWGELFTVQPFGNALVRMDVKGSDLRELLESQWAQPDAVRMLQISGFTYVWDSVQPVGSKVIGVQVNGAPLDEQRVYSVVVNSFLAAGGDAFRGGDWGMNHRTEGPDLEALVAFVEAHRDGIQSRIDGRISRLR